MRDSMETLPVIDTPKFSQHLRSRAIKLRVAEILITRFSGSKQAEDSRSRILS